MTRYEQGFMGKCAEYGIDGRIKTEGDKMPITQRQLDDLIAKRRRRSALKRILGGLAAAGVIGGGVYAGSKLLKDDRGAVVPVPTPSSGKGKSRLGRLAAIPAGIGIAALGATAARPALRRPLKALFGEEAAKLARKGGIARIFSGVNKQHFREYLSKIGIKNKETQNKLMKRLGYFFDESAAPAGKLKLYDFNPRGAKSTGGYGAISSPGAARMWDNKEFQAKMLRDVGLGHLMPQNIDKSVLDDAIKELHYRHLKGQTIDDKVINSVLKKRTGKDWFLKAKGNTAGHLPGEKMFEISPDDEEGLMTLAQFRKLLTNNVTYQEKIPTRKYGPLRERFWSSRIGRFIEDHSPVGREYGTLDKSGNRVRNLPHQTEYRVHVMNGQVIPYATSEKWDVSRHFSRFETKEKRDVERQVQEMMDKILAKQDKSKGILEEGLNARKQVFGLDVGVRPDGKMVVYEFNPSMPPDFRNGSGQLTHPDVQNAVNAAIKGRMPATQMLQLLGGGGAAIGGGAIAAGGIRGAAGSDS